MNAHEQKTELTNPPKHETKMVAPPKAETKMEIAPQKKGQTHYKLVVLRPFNIGHVEYGTNGTVKDSTRTAEVGQIIEVTRAQAMDLCKKIQGTYSFSGERHNADGDVTRHDLSRARIATVDDMIKYQAPELQVDESDIFSD